MTGTVESSESGKAPARCISRTWSSGAWRSGRCTRDAKIGDYCKQHDPEQKAKRAKKRGPTRSDQGFEARRRMSEILVSLDDIFKASVPDGEGSLLLQEARELMCKIWW